MVRSADISPDRILDAVREEGLLAPGSTVVAMLSGGRDSVCLLDVCVRLLGAGAVTALHVNYGLRDDADADERHCAALCADLGVGLEVERPRRPEGPGNLQAWARDARYAAAAKLAIESGSLVATGHTSDDQVETILYRLASSPSRRALLGMRRSDGMLVRPLLAFTRAETTAYCEQRGLGWRDDPTNDADSYARNRVRHGLAAALAAGPPGGGVQRPPDRRAPPRRGRGARRAGRRRARGRPRGSPRNTIELARLAELPPALRRLVVQQLADRAAGRPVPGAANHAEEVVGLRRTGTAMLDLGGGVRAVVERGVLRAER